MSATTSNIVQSGDAPMDILTTSAQGDALQLRTYRPDLDAIFPVTSTLVYGPTEAMLVDAQFQAKHARELVELVRSVGRILKYIFISHHDPDYYFGLAEISAAFPSAQVLSTAQTAYLISATKEAKLAVWADKLGPDAPRELVVPDATRPGPLVLDGHEIQVQSRDSDPSHSHLWIPSLRTILGGVFVSTGVHLWMADSVAPGAISDGIDAVDDMKKLSPARVIPSHSTSTDTSPEALDFVRDYLLAYREAAVPHAKASDIVDAMTSRFPDLPGRETLEFGARVLMGEAEWHAASPYPPIGRTAVVDFGQAAFELSFADHKAMSFRDLSGAFDGIRDTVEYTAVEVSKNVFMVYWHEPKTGANVVHVQNWGSGTVFTNIAGTDGSFLHFKGLISLR